MLPTTKSASASTQSPRWMKYMAAVETTPTARKAARKPFLLPA